MKNSFKVHAALFLVALIYAANYSLSKDVMPRYMGPFGIVTLRIVGAALFFAVVSRLVVPHDRLLGRADNLRAIGCGVLGIGLNQLLFFSGLNYTSPINASLLQTIAPIVVVLASAVLLGEKITLTRLLGIGVGAVGAATIILSRDAGSIAYPNATLGNILILLNATAFGVYLVLVTPLMRRYHPFTVLARIFLVGAFVAVPFGWRETLATDYADFPTYIWAEIVYMVVCLTILAYLLNNWALKYASPALLGVYIYLQPVLAVIIAVALGKDHFTLARAGQALLIFAGVWLVSRKPKDAPAAAVPLEVVQD
ncbi:Permease of the drug/metabolite transporter (DMT) superfamily [Hymenobacter daecheongensis DSM 21074]|uniref:Permease of the drug/metabolite transporter (DMT) superfamily n=1 Tax=Hymenobacter daecheongensis DSM 21074 TaxID=1121955 RepID=A0A1M6M0M1_9BACT|nr:DMT family transporter [Hymenobacter daecheongensis]SHJ77037.1 Permease of the drug/metabolite transporter (DMT) superfamily [Hymenobacter daecheongensis DSM 21074]